MGILGAAWAFIRLLLTSRAGLVAENLALRQQINVFRRSVKRPQLRKRDRIFWVWLSRFWSGWRSSLAIVQPATVARWHRQGFRLYWRRKSRSRGGRPKVERELQELIRRMSRQHILWGAPRIMSELRLLGYDVAESTVAKYMVRSKKPPSPTWRSFLANHVTQTAAIDFFTVPTITFRVLFCLLVLRHERRRVVHFNVTANPTAHWTARQLVAAFPFETAPRFLLRDRDGIYSDGFRGQVEAMGIEEVVIAPWAPWQNPYVERIVGSIRRECLDHMIVLNEAHLRAILAEYLSYYHQARTHLSLERNSPDPRQVEPQGAGRIVAESFLGGLHHRYRRAA